ncbi:MAG: hypothetical protein J0M12_05130 [Deltaproteobacteria bacterium]|nr:hypothetical protein [Deltaproteobacteria bacterium]
MKAFTTLFVCCLLFSTPAFAVTTLGSGYQCDGTKILDKRGKTVKIKAVKDSLNIKISALKVKIQAAKKAKKTAKVTSLSASLALVKASLSAAKKCANGTLTPPISPLWAQIAGTYSGNYDIVLSPNTPLGSGAMEVSNSFDGTTATTTIKFLSGIVQMIFSEPTIIQFSAINATFPIHQVVPGTPLGDLDVTLRESGEVEIQTVLPAGTFAGSDLSFLGNFSASTFPGSFAIGFQGTTFAEGSFTLTKP